MARRPQYQTPAWRARSSDDPGQDSERLHQTLKNRILLENYFLPGDLETQIAAFVADYNYAATTRASTISLPPTSTSGGPRIFWQNEKGSNDRPLPTAACSTGCTPPDFTKPMSQSLS